MTASAASPLPEWLSGRLTITVPEAGEALGIGRDAAYRAAAAGDIPTLRLGGRRLLVPVPKLLALLGVDDSATAQQTGLAQPLALVPRDGPGTPAA